MNPGGSASALAAGTQAPGPHWGLQVEWAAPLGNHAEPLARWISGLQTETGSPKSRGQSGKSQGTDSWSALFVPLPGGTFWTLTAAARGGGTQRGCAVLLGLREPPAEPARQEALRRALTYARTPEACGGTGPLAGHLTRLCLVRQRRGRRAAEELILPPMVPVAQLPSAAEFRSGGALSGRLLSDPLLSGGHQWAQGHVASRLVALCARCGAVRRADGINAPCRGHPPRLGLRAGQATE